MQQNGQPLGKSVRPGFMVDVCWRKWSVTDLWYRTTVILLRGTIRLVYDALKNLYIQCLTSKSDICEIKVGRTRSAHKMEVVFQSYQRQFTVQARLMRKEKEREEWKL